MKFGLLCVLYGAGLATGADPVRNAWIMSPSGRGAPAQWLPEVHSVSVGERHLSVRSGGISLKYLGPLQLNPLPSEGPREFSFQIPLHPQAAAGLHGRVPVDIVGVFLNGLPIYNHFEALSWNGANLWHYDTIAFNDDGAVAASGHPRAELTHAAPAGLLEQLVQDGSRHSPLIGFALDGFPIYGPWAYAHSDGSGGLRRMKSSYRLRSVNQREQWPDGTMLTPAQYGPDVNANEPAGTFAEDYEYRAGSGDLDEFNGRFAITPEYPGGTYAYFLSTDTAGRLAFPYLIGPRFHGRSTESAKGRWHSLRAKRMSLSASELPIKPGQPVQFRFEARSLGGDPIRHFEYTHERPIHLIITSADLAEFDHIHPKLMPDDSYNVEYTFAHGGKYRLWADYALPGEAPRVDQFDINVDGTGRAQQPLTQSSEFTQTANSLRVELVRGGSLRAGEDIQMSLRLAGSTGRLEPYLGAWAHVIIIGEGLHSFAHAHPIENATPPTMAHTHAIASPPPDAIQFLANFPTRGLYKLWAQFQEGGHVLTVPFVLRVAAPALHTGSTVSVPANAIRIRVTQHGYEPSRIEIPAGTKVTLAFTRDSNPNCGSEVVFPTLGIRTALPVAGTVLVRLPATTAASKISFSCGMGMYRGMVVAR